jgi:peptide chain release factor 2
MDIEKTLDEAKNLLAVAKMGEWQAAVEKLEAQTLTGDFWGRSDAKEVMQEMAQYQAKIAKYQQLKEQIDEVETAQFLFDEENTPEYQTAAEIATGKLAKTVKVLSLEQYLSGKYDGGGALFSIHSGQGGTEAMDFASMLQRMYTRYFERKDWKYTLVGESRGEEAGIKAVTYEVNAPYAYGYLKNEKGTHRLVRLSPFNADNLRQTSFALVEVLPVVAENDKSVEINPNDLEWHFTRAGGAGGQNVNKVNTAVELHYIPLDITVRCREERSQAQNKERALQILRAKIAIHQEEIAAREMASVKGAHVNASWGSQIRNYVLHPYQLVKDTRTGVETSDTEGVLDGDIDLFIENNLIQLA